VLSGELQLILSWNTGELDEEQVQEMGKYYTRILGAIAQNPHDCHEQLAQEIKKEVVELQDRKTKQFKETRRQKLQNLKRGSRALNN
jgi:acetyl-CoA carboxylase alpha subunit